MSLSVSARLQAADQARQQLRGSQHENKEGLVVFSLQIPAKPEAGTLDGVSPTPTPLIETLEMRGPAATVLPWLRLLAWLQSQESDSDDSDAASDSELEEG